MSLPSVRCKSTVPGFSDCTDTTEGHGTAVAGVAVAVDNDIDVVGVAPSATFGSIRVCRDGDGDNCKWDDMAEGLDLARLNGVPEVVNMSIGGGFSAVVATAAAQAYNAGDLLVASAGNDGPGVGVNYPAALTQFIAVSGTVTNGDDIHPESQIGGQIEFSAPYSVFTLHLNHGTANWTGTSFASPAVAGVAALVWALHPTWTNVTVRTHLRNGVDDLGAAGWDQQFGWGRINAEKAVEAPIPPITSTGISDPSTVQSGVSYQWNAQVNGGLPPYSYQWSGKLSGSNWSVVGNLTSSGWAYLQVTDATGQQGNASKYITVQSGGGGGAGPPPPDSSTAPSDSTGT